MSLSSITLPVPINVEHKRPGSRSTLSKKAYNIGKFELPSYSASQVSLVAQWSQNWNELARSSTSDIDLSSENWSQKLSEAEHMVALVSVAGSFYVPVRAAEREGANQHLVKTGNALNILERGLGTITPFGSKDLHPQFMGFNFRNYGIGGGERPFSETGLPDGMVLVGSNERERIDALAGYLSKNFIIIDGMLFSSVVEPKIVVRPAADKVFLHIATDTDDNAIMPVFNHYFRLDDHERALQMVEERWDHEAIVPRFTDLKIADTIPLSEDFEATEALRVVKRFHSTLAESLKEIDWEVAEQWYALKKLLTMETPDEEQLEKMVSLVDKAVDALRVNSDVDAEWRDKRVLYGRLGVERWNYRPVEHSGPRF